VPNPKVKKYPTFPLKEGIFVAKRMFPLELFGFDGCLNDLICCLFWRLSVLGLERCVLGVYGENPFDHGTELLVVVVVAVA
jgi:hypothetical protein